MDGAETKEATILKVRKRNRTYSLYRKHSILDIKILVHKAVYPQWGVGSNEFYDFMELFVSWHKHSSRCLHQVP